MGTFNCDVDNNIRVIIDDRFSLNIEIRSGECNHNCALAASSDLMINCNSISM